MSKTKGVNAFINYLEEEQKKAKKPTIKFVAVSKEVANTKYAEFKGKTTDRELEINFILKRITMSDEEYLKHMEIFYHFKDLSNYMEEANLSCRDTFNLVMYVLKRNLMCINRAKKAKAINDTELRKHTFENISASEINSLISSGEINRIINGCDEELNDREREIRDSILACSEEYSTDIDDLMKEHLAIEDHYFNKKDTYTEEDMDIIISNLQTLTFSNEVCEMVKHVLAKQLSSRIQPKEEPITITNQRLYPIKKEPEIEYKEQKDVYNHIREYYNIPKKEIVKDVNYDEMLYIVSLMLKINIDLKTIRSYIRQVTAKLENTDDPGIKYQTFKAKLSYYITEEDLSYLDELYSAFKEDESLWMEEFMNYLDEIMRFVSETDTYTYELETAKQLLKNGN